MQSVARNHYPQYVFRDGAKLLWNPVLKKGFVDRPEERVRLQIVEYLLREVGFSASRISFESPVHLPRDKSASRTDVICFDKEFQPLLLIECKASEIKLTEKASIQIARYNQKVGAPFLLITNGLEDFWFSSVHDKIKACDDIPKNFFTKKSIQTDFEYWCERGFGGKKSHPDTRSWIKESCEFLYGFNQKSLPTYFKFEGSPQDLYMVNYYQTFTVEESLKLALSLTSTPFGTTKLNGVLNYQGSNIALISCSLDLIATNDSKNTVIQSAAGSSYINLVDEIDFNFIDSIDDQVQNLTRFLSQYVTPSNP